jgi:hypothetical protein
MNAVSCDYDSISSFPDIVPTFDMITSLGDLLDQMRKPIEEFNDVIEQSSTLIPFPDFFPLPPLDFFRPAHAIYDHLFPRLIDVHQQTEILLPQDFYHRIARRSEDFYDLLGICLDEFELLHTKVYYYLQQPRNPKNRADPKIGRPNQLCSRNRLLLVLQIIRHAPPSPILHELYGVNDSYISREFEHMIHALDAALAEELDWPDEEIRKLLMGTIPEFPTAIGSLDGMAAPIRTSSNSRFENDTFRKDKGHMLNVLTVCDYRKILLHLSPGYKGSANDVLMYRLSDLGTGIISSFKLLMIRITKIW